MPVGDATCSTVESIKRRMPRTLHRAALAGLGLALIGTAACRDQESPTSPEDRIDPAFLTGNAAASINANGQFVLAKGGHGPYAEISQEQAMALAAAYIHRYGRLAVQRYEADRGGPIDIASLQPCPRAYYVVSAYEPVPPSVSLLYRKALGPQWLVSMCTAGGVPEISVAVSAYATDVSLGTPDAPLPDPGSANFVSHAIPVGAEIPTPPEAAAALLARAMGKRVSEVPQLVMRPQPDAPMLAVWEIALEAPARVRGQTTAAVRDRDTLFIGPQGSWNPSMLDADPTAPADSVATFLDGRLSPEDPGIPFTVHRRPELVRAFEVVTPESQ